MNRLLTGMALLWIGLSCLFDSSASADEVTRTGEDFFESRIRPVLVKRCFKCHSGDKREGKLRLDQREALVKGGQSGKVVLPRDPNGSLLIRAIRRVDSDLSMPPEDTDRLTADEVRDFVAWVKMGAPYPDAPGHAVASPVADLREARRFWSLQPITRPQPPDVEPTDWPRSDIDRFVLDRLKANRMQPSARAGKQALIRRVTCDLIGLPPTPAEVDAFLADDSADAFATVVDRLLESPQYGVHWARHWFDVARYGDTRWVGAGEDRRWPFAYTYRDWVIQAINDDMPYDRFVTLQIAADQVPDARPADHAALGFLTVGRWFTGQLPDVIDDQIDVVTRGLLGMSAQCARCHDHKFDPISTQDYYSLYGLFAASRMPVDGNGILGDLPEVAPRPVDAATETDITRLRSRIDEFLNSRVTALRNDFRARPKLLEYFRLATTLLEKDDNEVRAFAKSKEHDERLLLRWVQYLKRTLPQPNRDPHQIFTPWHALAAVPVADIPTTVNALLDRQKADKLNPQVAAMLSPPPESLGQLATRYVDLFLKFDLEDRFEDNNDYDKERLRQVLRGNDSPVYVRMNELGQFLSPVEFDELTGLRRNLHTRLVGLSEQADQFLTYQHEARPLLSKLNSFLDERREAAAAAVRSPDTIVTYLLAAHEAKDFESRQFRNLAKSRQLSPVLLRRWIEFLQRLEQHDDPVFAAWCIITADDSDFAGQARSLAEHMKQASGNRAVATAFEKPPASLSDAANRYGELLARCNQAEPFADADLETVRQVVLAADSPLRYSPEGIVDHLTRRETDQLRNHERNLARLYLESPGTPALGMVLRESSGSYAQRVFVRGNSHHPGEMSHGGIPLVLVDQPQPFTRGRGRWELAQSIVDERNPLTARVIVNRVWQWHFGSGLVRTPSDFGTRGEAPTHPRLLDWLAAQFMADGWSLKKLHRRILLSSTWQQSSRDNPAYRSTDPENRLLWRMSRRRLSFEELRDSLLAVSGRLDQQIGGRPSDLVKNIVRRRTVFGKVDRMALPGFYRYFDFPGADTHVPERHETIVAQQALYLMNNGFVLDQASYVAQRTAMTEDPAARIDAMYRLVLGRRPSDEERSLSLEFIKSQRHANPVVEPDVDDAKINDEAETPTAAAPVPADAWRYGWGSYDVTGQRVTDFNPFRFSTGDRWRGGENENDPELGRIYLHSRIGHAGPNSELSVIRRWIAPRGGRLSISGAVSSQLNSTEPLGDGVRARIVSSRRGQLGAWLVCGTEESTDIPELTVEPGDTIDFVVDARGRDNHASIAWAPVLRMDASADSATNEALVWDSAKDFKTSPPTAPPFDVWQRYAQVLLESNEFTFLD